MQDFDFTGRVAMSDEVLEEMNTSEYLVFIFALETFLRYLRETEQEIMSPHMIEGVRMIRRLESVFPSVVAHLKENLPTEGQKKMVDRAAGFILDRNGLPKRVLLLRTALERGGAATITAVFPTNRFKAAVRAALAASVNEDADAALDVFKAITLRNKRVSAWIEEAAKIAVPMVARPVNPVTVATATVAETQAVLQESKVAEDAANPTSSVVLEESRYKEDVIKAVEDSAKESAKKAIEGNGELDTPPTKSEVVGIAAAMIAAATADTDESLPPAIKRLRDPEQRDVAMATGRVVVQAGAGSGKCVVGSTLIRTSEGFVRIQDFAEGMVDEETVPLEIEVQGIGGIEKTAAIYRDGFKQTRKVVTRMGYALEGTGKHPILVLRGGEIQWVKLSEVEEGDYACIDRRPHQFPEAPFKVSSNPTFTDKRVVPNKFPEELTPEVASFLGYVVSEGSFSIRHGIQVCTSDPDQLSLTLECLNKYGVPYSVKKDKRSGVFSVGLAAKANVRALMGFGLSPALSHDKSIPEGVLRSPRKVVSAFLRSLFDGAGWFSGSTVGYATASETLARDVQEVLLGYGILSKLRFKSNAQRGVWDLTINGDSARTFLREIGFGLSRKNEKALELLNTPSNTNVDVVPGVQHLFLEACDAVRERLRVTTAPNYPSYKSVLGGTRDPSRATVMAFLSDVGESSSTAAEKLAAIAQSPWFFDRIESIEEGEAEVYDFVVPGTHSFSGGGFVNHNTTSVVSMLQYLVEDKGVPPEKIFVGVFNVEAANTIVSRARKLMGDEKVGQMALGTMHSRFLRSILKYGTGEIREAFTKRVISDRSSKSPNPFITPSQINGVMAQVWEACFGDSRPLPKGVSTQMEKWKFNDIPPDQALAEALDRNEQSLAIWYEWQAGFKGHLGPNWKPPCVGNRVPSKQEFDFNGNLKSPNKAESKWWTFVAKYRTGQDGRLGEKLLVDQTDMILKFRDLLRDNPAARKEIQEQYSHIIFDEAQDLSKVAHQIADYLGEKIEVDSTDKLLMFIGDTNQAVNCVDVETPVNTPEGFKRAGDLVPGDTVLSYRNGSVVKQVVSGTLKTSPTEGVKVTTRSGNTLTMTKQHRIWADTAIDPSVGEYIVYLMYRSGFGYRVGVTSTGYNGSGYLRLAMRARSELAESMWVLKVCKTVSEALIEEETVSLNFGVPKCVFNGHYRDLDQERLNEVFKRFGHNGVAILEDMGANSDLPHWRPSSFTGSDLDHRGSSRRIMQMIAHTPKGTLVTLEWTGEDLLSKIKDHLPGVSVSKAKDTSSGLARYRFRKHFNKYQEASAFAEHASSVLGTTLNRRISVEESTPLMLVHAGGLQPGMQVISLGEDGEVFLDPIVSVDVVQGDFVDLEVTDAANFFGGGILSHNSFVGGSPKHMADRYTSGFQLKTIRANHRCLPEIVEAANRLMSNHPKTIPFEAVPDPAKPRGQASIEVMSVPDQSIAANNVTRRWLNEVAISGEDFSKYAVLSRTRRELDTYEMACILNGVPYSRKGAGSFLQAPEMKTVVGYMNLATSNDYKSLKKSLAHVINTPNRFFLKGDVDKDALIDSAINQLARSRGVNSEQVDPLDLLTTGDGLKAMVYALKIPRSLNFRDDWRGRQAEELLENLGTELMRIRSNVASNANADPSQPVSYSTSELINDILNIEGLPEGPAREKKPVKVLDVLVPPLKRLDDEEGSEKVEDPEEAALGTVYFLKTLAQGSKAMENKGLRAENPDDFIQYIRSLNDAAKDLRVDVKAWNAEQEALYPDNPELRKKAPAVTLSTIHSIKGAEWPDTTVIMTHGTFPFTPRPLDNEDRLDEEQQARLAARREEDFLTERQLAYVAMTRASEKLTIVSQNRFRGRHIPPSQFILEAGLVTGENVTGQPDAIPPDGGDVRTAAAAVVAPYDGFFVESGEYL